jgi:hypothetical protein
MSGSSKSCSCASRLRGRRDALILRRALIGDNQDDYNVLENGVVVGRIFTVRAAGSHLDVGVPSGPFIAGTPMLY